jgi:hypothetical protein
MFFISTLSSTTQVFTLTTHATLRLGSLVTESARQLRLRRTLRQLTPTGGCVFELTALARVQTPMSGVAGLSAELAPLLETLLVETDATGRLARVANKAQLRERWADLLPTLRRKYRQDPDVPPALLAQLGQVLDGDDTLEAVLARSPEYGLLFPPLYDQYLSPDTPLPGSAVLSRFVGEMDLPLRTETLLEAAAPAGDIAGTVRVAGEVDEPRYAADEARRALCALTDQPNLDTRVVALHQETYIFGRRHELVEASRHTRGEVPGVMSRELTVLLHTRDN